MMNSIKKYSIYLFTVFLFACAGGEVKQEGSEEVFGKKVDHVDVDSDIEMDFNKAVGLLNQADYQQAITVFKTVIEREQRLPAPYVNIAIAYNN